MDGCNVGTVISAAYGDEMAKAVELAHTPLLTATRRSFGVKMFCFVVCSASEHTSSRS
jgi:hypothetical protein